MQCNHLTLSLRREVDDGNVYECTLCDEEYILEKIEKNPKKSYISINNTYICGSITHKLKNFGKAISPNNYKLISNDRLEFINMANDPDRRGGVSRPSLPMPYLSTDTGC